MVSLLLLAQVVAASPEPTRFELPNGLRVWVQEDASRPVALVHITYHAGSLNEGPGVTGIAHYVEHMVYRATENVRNEDVYGYIDRIGGRYTGGTWPDVTRYAETVPAWALESALRVTAERMTRALFDSLEFERERSNVVTEAHGFADTDPVDALRDATMMAAFELHPYRYGSNTWARDNLILTRARAVEWYRTHYGPNNAVLVVVGDVKTADVRRLVERHFGPLARAPGSGRIDVMEPPQLAEKRILMTAPADSSRLEVLYRLPSARDSAFPALHRFDEVFAPRLRETMSVEHPGVRVETHDTATAYPYVYRIAVASGRNVDMTAVLATIDAAIQSVIDRPAAGRDSSRPAMQEPGAEERSAAGPPRRSNLTRIAESLAARELPPWELSGELRDSIAARARRVTASELAAFTRTWLVPRQRTVGLLQATASEPPVAAIDVPALTTPPARRMRPDPVPAEALRPLRALPIERATRTLRNGVIVRVARVAGKDVHARAVVVRGARLDTVVRSFPIRTADAGLQAMRREIATRTARRDSIQADSSVDDRARARVIAAIAPASAGPGGPSSIAIVGPLPPAELLAMAERHFSGLPAQRTFRSRDYFPTVGPREELIPVRGERQVEIVAGIPGVHRNHPDRRALELLNYIVGVPYYGGRLGWALTKSGLTYSSAATSTFGESGYVLVSTTADTRNTPATIQAIREVIAGVGEGGVEDWELQEAKAFMLGRALLYGAREDSPASVIAAALTDSDEAALELLDLPALSRAYLNVTLDEINRVARSYYRGDMLKVVAMGAIPPADMRSPFEPGTFRALFEP